MSVNRELRSLFLRLFPAPLGGGLEVWVSSSLPEHVSQNMPRGPIAERVQALVDYLRRYNLIDSDLFESLKARFPSSRDEIAHVEEVCLAPRRDDVEIWDESTSLERPLAHFFAERFSVPEMQGLLHDVDEGILARLPPSASVQHFAWDLVAELDRHGVIDHGFFDVLRHHRPRAAREIDRLEWLWLDPELKARREAVRLKEERDRKQREEERLLQQEREREQAIQREKERVFEREMAEMAERERQAIRERVESQARLFVSASKDELLRRERRYSRIAYFCYVVGGMALVSGAALVLYRGTQGLKLVSGRDWYALLDFVLIGVIGVAFVVAVSRYTFLLGKAFMTEALTNSDRRHAIAFGEFYLLAYGEQAKWDELKEAFQHWNVGRGSGFTQQSPDEYDPRLVASAVELIQALREKAGDTTKLK